MDRPIVKTSLVLLGWSGFLGLALRRELARVGSHAGWDDVHLLGRTPPPAGARGSVHDGEEPGALAAALAGARPTHVLSCAALARGGDCARAPERARRLNTELAAELAAACAQLGARFLHVSTDLVFGGEPPPPGGHPESAAPAPIDVYGASKAAGDLAVLAAAPDALVARLPLLHGDSGGRGLGASDALLAEVDAGREVVLFDDEWRTPLDVDVAARALLDLLAGTARGVVHLPGPQRLTRAAFGRQVLERASRASAQVRSAPRAALGLARTRPGDVSLAGERARLLLGDGWNAARASGRP
jgi:dTDP-4-dehydrorhamnose reductase